MHPAVTAVHLDDRVDVAVAIHVAQGNPGVRPSTDGLTDAINADRQRFGLEQLQLVAAAHSGRSARELADAIYDAVTTFAGDVTQFDDFTLVVARRLV